MKQLKNRIFLCMLAAMGLTLAAGVVLFPLLLPTENYFRMAAQLFPMALIIALLLAFPLHALSFRFARAIVEARRKAAFSVEPAAPTVIDIPTEAAPPPPSQQPSPAPAKPRAPRKPRTKPAPAVTLAPAEETPEIDIPAEPAPTDTSARPAKPRAPRKPRTKKAPAEAASAAGSEQPAAEKKAEDQLPMS